MLHASCSGHIHVHVRSEFKLRRIIHDPSVVCLFQLPVRNVNVGTASTPSCVLTLLFLLQELTYTVGEQ